MGRGRKRKFNPTIPAHIDQAALPRGLYWDKSGNGRWYVLDANPETGKPSAKTVASADAKLSELHAIVEVRAGGSTRGTITHVLEQFHASLDFTQLAKSTRDHYEDYAKAIKAYPAKHGKLGEQFVDRLAPPVFRHLVDTIAQGKPATKPGDKAVPGYPTKANHWLRYLRRAFGWGIEHGTCKTNPCRGVKCVREVRDHRMPELAAFRNVQMYARACSLLGARQPGSLPPYLWAAMEIGYQARLRGIEVLTLTDAHNWADDLLTNRRKGSRDSLVRKNTNLARAIDAVRLYRTEVWKRKRREIPIRPEQRYLFVGEDGDPLSRRGFNTAWGRMMRNAVKDGVLAKEDRFGLHGLKHRGVTDTKGDKKKASGHKTDAMVHLYDHELPRVDPAGQD